jgi:hypothetical protein
VIGFTKSRRSAVFADRNEQHQNSDDVRKHIENLGRDAGAHGLQAELQCLGGAHRDGGQKNAHGMTTAQDDDHQSNISFPGGNVFHEKSQQRQGQIRTGFTGCTG